MFNLNSRARPPADVSLALTTVKKIFAKITPKKITKNISEKKCCWKKKNPLGKKIFQNLNFFIAMKKKCIFLPYSEKNGFFFPIEISRS